MDIEDNPSVFVPGPGAYSPYFKKRNPSYSLSSRWDVRPREPTPGPGQYQFATAFRKNTGSRLSGRTVINPTYQTPGPGAYSPVRQQRSLSPSLSGRTFRQYGGACSPGPAAYNSPDRLQRQNGIVLKSRTYIGAISQTPGPGAYTLQGGFGKYGSTLKSRTATIQDKNVSPGPGAYEIPSKSFDKRNGISMSGRPKKRGGIMM